MNHLNIDRQTTRPSLWMMLNYSGWLKPNVTVKCSRRTSLNWMYDQPNLNKCKVSALGQKPSCILQWGSKPPVTKQEKELDIVMDRSIKMSTHCALAVKKEILQRE